MTDHVHTQRAARCCPAEPAADVLWKLRANEPIWTPRALSEAHPEHKDPSLSASGETREMFKTRYTAWKAACAREEATQARESAEKETAS